jgi:hypothetical protein
LAGDSDADVVKECSEPLLNSVRWRFAALEDKIVREGFGEALTGGA